MKKLLLSTCLLVPAALVAQITINSSNLIATGQNIITHQVDLTSTSLTVTPAGPNQVWDFSGLTIDPDGDTVRFDSPVGKPFASDYPTATHAFGIQLMGTSFSQFYQLAPTGLFELGGKSQFVFNPIPGLVSTSLQETRIFGQSRLLPLPLSSSFTSVSFSNNKAELITATNTQGGTVINSSKTRQGTRESIIYSASGWGTVILPGGGSTPVLRFRRETTRFDSVYVYDDVNDSFTLDVVNVSNSIEFEYLSNDGSLLVAVQDVDPSAPTVVTEMTVQRKTGVSLQPGQQAALLVYPNPAQGSINIQLSSLSQPASHVLLVGADGKTHQLPLPAGQATATLQVGHLPAGLYTYTVWGSQAALATGRVVLH